MPSNDNNTNVNVFTAQARGAMPEWRDQPCTACDDIPLVPDPVMPCGAGSTTPAASAPAPKNEEDLSRQIYQEYCRNFGKLAYEPFTGEWNAAARIVQELGAKPEAYIEAQLRRRMRLDPEDLATPTAVAVYRSYAASRDQGILDAFLYAYNRYQSLLVADFFQGCRPYNLLLSPISPVQANSAFRMIAALVFCPHEDRVRIAELYCEEALDELRCSPKLQQYLREHWKANIAGILRWMEGAVAINTELDAARIRSAGNKGGAA